MGSFTCIANGRYHTGKAYSIFIVSILTFNILSILPLPGAGEASDWGEEVGNYLLEHNWGYGTTDNLTLSSVAPNLGVLELASVTDYINMSAQELQAGTADNVTVTSEDSLVLETVDASWQQKDTWNPPTVSQQYAAVALGDLDADGDLDVLVGQVDGSIVGINNTGSPFVPAWTFHDAWNQTIGTDYAVPALADIDGDGDLDLFIGDMDGITYAWENVGTRHSHSWSANSSWDVPDIGSGASPEFGDLDGDGDLDALVGSDWGETYGINNTGTSTSPVWTVTPAWDGLYTNAVSDPAIGDLDGDGDLDHLIGRMQGTCYGGENIGDASSPSWTTKTAWDVPDVGQTASPVFGDLDADGDLDVLVGERTGDTIAFENVGLRAPNGIFLSEPFGAGQQVIWSSIEWGEKVPANTTATISTRTGNTTDPTDGTWSSWSQGLGDPTGSDITLPPGSYLQVRALLGTTDVNLTPVVWGINITYANFEDNGTIVTNDLVITDPVRWDSVDSNYTTNGQSVEFFYSLDNGTSWTALPSDGNITSVSVSEGKIRFKVEMSTADTLVSPEFTGLTVKFMALLAPDHLHLSPTTLEIQVGQSSNFTAELHDINNNTLTPVLNWSSDIGTIDNGTFTAPTVPGNGTVNVTFGNMSVFANVTVLPGPVDRIAIEPDNIITTEGETIHVNATGFDIYDNELFGLDFNWSTDVGTVDPAVGPNTTFTARNLTLDDAGQNVSGKIEASHGDVTAGVNVTVFRKLLTSLVIAPRNVTVMSGDTVTFNATGHDQFGDTMNVSVNWESDVGIMSPRKGVASVLTTNIMEGNGTVTASLDNVSDTVNVEVLPNGTYPYPEITGDVPDQVRMEDSPPWELDLNPFEGGGVSDDNLLWHVEGLDRNMVEVMGEEDTGDRLTFVPLPDACGSNLVTYVLEDENGYRDTFEAWIRITPVDDAPEVNPLPDIQIRYDTPFTFNHLPYVTDIDTPIHNLSLAIGEVNPAGKPLNVTMDDFNVTYLAPESLVGEKLAVTIQISDAVNTVKDSITVTVTDNWIPELSVPLPDVVLYEGEKKLNVFDLDDHFVDRDKDVMFYTYGNNKVDIVINDNHSVDMEASSEWSGQELVTFRATDSDGGLVEDVILVTVRPVDDEPEINGVPDLYVHFDSIFTFDLRPYITDVDTPTEDLVLMFTDEHVWWAWDPEKSTVNLPKGASKLTMVVNFPEELDGQPSPYSVDVTIRVSDGQSSDEDGITVFVSDNWPPVLDKHLPDIEFNEDTVLTGALKLTNYFRDPDGGALSFSAQSRTINVSIGGDGTVDLSSPSNWFGIETVTFRAKDQKGSLIEDTIFVTVLPVNDPPVLNEIPPQEMVENNILTISLAPFISDVDDSLRTLSINVTLDTTLLSVFVSGTDIVVYSQEKGEYTLTLTVTDSHGASTEQVIDIEVKAGAGPPAPTAWESLLMMLVYMIILAILVGAMASYFGYRKYFGKYHIEEAFLIFNDGRLIAHVSHQPVTEKDETVFSGMVTAVQMFIEDTFKEKEMGNAASGHRMEYKDNIIMIERGKFVYLALLLKGEPGKKLVKDMNALLSTIEMKHGGSLHDWDGDHSELRGISDYLIRLVPGGYTTALKVDELDA
jgi:hypothetical protein